MAEREQVFFDFKLNFNLCKPSTRKPTAIYAVVYFKGKQYRINTGVKVYPVQWNKKRQLAIISSKQTYLDNYNNTIVNDKLKQILLSFEQSKTYLCNHVESISNLYELFKQYINPNMRSKKATKDSVPATNQLQLLLSDVEKDSTRSIYRGNINVFKKFLDEESIPDTWDNITGENLEKYKEYLIKKGNAVTTINNCLNGLMILLRKAHKDKSKNYDFNKSGCDKVEKVQDKRSKEEKKSKQIPLTEEQVKKLYELKLSGRDEEVRDVFVVQCLLGQRISDMPKLFAGNYKIVKENIVEITVQKTQEQAIIYLFPIAKEILNKYKECGFKHLKINTAEVEEDTKNRNYANRINERIKEICKSANFNEEIIYTEQRGTQKVRKMKAFHELIHTQLARHTFITLMCKMGITKETVIIATAHEDTKMIEEVYLHVSSQDKAKKLGEAIEEKAHGNMFVAHKKVEKTEDIDVFNYIFAGDLLLGLAKKYEATKEHESLDKDLDKGFLELPTTKEAITILKDTSRINNIDRNKHFGSKELKTKVKSICTIVWEIGKASNDVILIQFFQDNVITLGLNTQYYLSKTMSKREVQQLFNMKSYKGTIIA